MVRSPSSGQPLRYPELGGAGARVAGDFRLGRSLGASGEKPELGLCAKAAIGCMTRGARLRLAMAAQELLHDTIFQTVERDHRQTAFGPEDLQRGVETAFQLAQLVIHMNAQG